MHCNNGIFSCAILHKLLRNFSRKFMRKSMTSSIQISLMFAFGLLTTACGGGGGGGGSSAIVAVDSTPAATNVQPVAVIGGPANSINLLMTSVKICTPGSTTACQTIDNILVDTGSVGLRIMASELDGSAVPTTVPSPTGQPLVQCQQFADGFTWGPVKRVDVRIAGELASNIPIQIVGDTAHPTVPNACTATGNNNSTVADFGAKGVLGIGFFQEDCGNQCALTAVNGRYYRCVGTVCTDSAAPLVSQVRNPISNFAVNNNGVIIDLPSVPTQGAATIVGSMIFGIGTQSNNGLGNARVLDIDPNFGTFSTVATGATFSGSFVDTGSNGLFFPTRSTPGYPFPISALPVCGPGTSTPDFFCPNTNFTATPTLQAFSNSASAAVTFSIGHADNLLNTNPTFHAFNNIGAPIPSTFINSFDWGLPFYFGRRVYSALESASTPAGTGPYIAF